MKRSIFAFLLLTLCAGLVFAEEQTISKKELYSRARDALKTSLETGNKERAEQALGYLQKNVKDGAPLIRFEEYLVNMELGNYETALSIYADLRRTVLDPDYKPKEELRLVVDDPLAAYLRRGLRPFTIAKADSLYALVNKSDVKEEDKKLYRALLYSELMHEDLASGEAFIAAAKDYAMFHPTSPYAEFLKNYTIPYAERIWKRMREFKEDPLKHKYYTGGLGAHVYTLTGFMTGDIADYTDVEMSGAFLVDVTMRLWRVSLNAFLEYGMSTEPKNIDEDSYWSDSEDESIGLTLGFTAFDSRYFRVEPFLGWGASYFMSDELASDDFIIGCNADFRFWASKPARLGDFSVAFDLRFKYMFQLGTFSDYNLTDSEDWSANRHTFAIGLGVELW